MRRTLLFLLFAAVGFLGCTKNKHTGRNQLLVFSDGQMTKMGVEAYAQMTGPGSEARISNNPALNAPLQRVGAAIAAVGSEYLRADGKENYEWEFRLIDDPKTVNAWALPGGKIAFYTAIYPILQDEAGMAIVMGHEVMHAILEHGNERMSQNALFQGVNAAASVGLAKSRYRNEILAGLGMGVQVGVLLPYSRSHESEADRQGLILAAKAGYNPQAAIGVWQRMAEAGGGKRPPEFLSTHPDPLKRIEQMRQWMPEAMRYYAQSQKRANRPLPPIR